MSEVPSKFKQEVRLRAAHRCEYCQLSQLGQEAEFHVDHVIPQVSGGKTALDNLALACVSCSLRKGAKEIGIDPASNTETPLFNPRLSNWQSHFRWIQERVEGLTPIGRTTVAALAMNRVRILEIRYEEIQRGRHPPT